MHNSPRLAPPIDHALDYLREPSDVPEKQFIKDVRWFLVSRRYTPVAIQEVLRHVRLFGTVACCVSVDEEDWKAVEKLLPVSPQWDMGKWDSYTAEDGPGLEF